MASPSCLPHDRFGRAKRHLKNTFSDCRGLWFVFTGLAAFYVFALATMQIPFGPPMTFAAVLRRLSVSRLFNGDISWAFHGAVLLSSTAATLLYTLSSSRIRVVVALLCLVAPLLWTARGFKGIAQWVLAMPAAPCFTFTALTGQQDGEFYAEGFLVFAAIGWWMLLWCVLLFTELSHEP